MKQKNHFSLLFNLIFAFTLFFSSAIYGQYCTGAFYTNSCNAGSANFIKNVSLIGTTLNNNSVCTSTTPNGGITIYPATGSTTAALQQGNTYSLSVTTSNLAIISVWIDYNHNNLFDATEWTQVDFVSAANVASVVSITIPFTSVTGTTGMRIRIRDDGQPNAAGDACTLNWLSGEGEQYTVTINAAPTCTAPPVAGTTFSTADTVCPTTEFTLSLQGAAIAQGLAQQWQSSPNGTAWANIAGQTGTTLTTTQFVSTYYQCLVTCSGSTVASIPRLISMLNPEYYNTWGSGNVYSEHFETWQDACDDNDVPSPNWINTPISGNESWRKQNEGFTTGNWTFPNGGFNLIPHTGSGAAEFHSFSGAGLPGTLDLYLNCTNYSSVNLDFWYFKNQNGFDKFEIYLSRNAGFTFDDTLITLRNSVVGQYGPVWVNYFVNTIPVNNSPQCVLRFKDFGDIFGSNDTGLDDVSISGILGTDKLATDNSNVKIFPNPSNGRVELSCRNKNFTKINLQLIDMTGRIVYTDNLQNTSTNWNQSLDWSEQAKGIYFVKLISDTHVYTQKIVIE